MSEELTKQLGQLSSEARAVRNRLWRMGVAMTSFASFLTDRYLGLEVKEASVQPLAFWPHRRGSVNLHSVAEAMNLGEILNLAKRYYELEDQRFKLCERLGLQWSATLP